LGNVIDDGCKCVCWCPVDCFFDLGDVGDAALHIFKAGGVGINVGGVGDGGCGVCLFNDLFGKLFDCGFTDAADVKDISDCGIGGGKVRIALMASCTWQKTRDCDPSP
jgi:hypothetical protein